MGRKPELRPKSKSGFHRPPRSLGIPPNAGDFSPGADERKIEGRLTAQILCEQTQDKVDLLKMHIREPFSFLAQSLSSFDIIIFGRIR